MPKGCEYFSKQIQRESCYINKKVKIGGEVV